MFHRLERVVEVSLVLVSFFYEGLVHSLKPAAPVCIQTCL